MNPNLYIPWIFIILAIFLLMVPNSWSEKKVLAVIAIQIFLSLVGLVTAITNLVSLLRTQLNLGLSISAIILAIITILLAIQRRLKMLKNFF
ncbi:hypothetical protein [Mycoplasma amphoriforme]|uniref:Uncharacterized protein n=1 Tax=Mycoplasma amphoriforme A39 TaxID=572419 RepID=A0A292IIW0_9MOLU|nr:unnamed protein product [Mycoplasma amphoriforme A39]